MEESNNKLLAKTRRKLTNWRRRTAYKGKNRI
jgi:hypothetical protein